VPAGDSRRYRKISGNQIELPNMWGQVTRPVNEPTEKQNAEMNEAKWLSFSSRPNANMNRAART